MTILYKALWQFYGWDSWFSGWLTAVLVPTENAWLMLMSNRKTRWQMSTIKCVHISRFALSTMQKQQEGGPSFRSITSLFKCVMLLKTMDWSTLTKWWNDLIKVYIPFGFTCERLPWPPPPSCWIGCTCLCKPGAFWLLKYIWGGENTSFLKKKFPRHRICQVTENSVRSLADCFNLSATENLVKGSSSKNSGRVFWWNPWGNFFSMQWFFFYVYIDKYWVVRYIWLSSTQVGICETHEV